MRYLVMMKLEAQWLQIGTAHNDETSARNAINEYRRGPDVDKTFRVFVDLTEKPGK